ncbi:hypothetical protein H5410_045937 [Solanum commersonii]|uniref:Uncharacterized protein n=1 Tax=Solanum commersonii TaxID=4109 RepID=A0A9J5XD27_SOLCO|nr:hypothetical protein H5410_045937 [Solanum commersonii]
MKSQYLSIAGRIKVCSLSGSGDTLMNTKTVEKVIKQNYGEEDAWRIKAVITAYGYRSLWGPLPVQLSSQKEILCPFPTMRSTDS